MNFAHNKLEEIGHLDAVAEYAEKCGVGPVHSTFEYSVTSMTVTAQVIAQNTGIKSTRTEGLPEFLNSPDEQDQRCLKMLKACVDELSAMSSLDMFKSLYGNDPKPQKFDEKEFSNEHQGDLKPPCEPSVTAVVSGEPVFPGKVVKWNWDISSGEKKSYIMEAEFVPPLVKPPAAKPKPSKPQPSVPPADSTKRAKRKILD